MDRRQFIKGVCSVFAAVVLPIPKIVTKVARHTFSCGLTLLELARRESSPNQLSKIVEILNESNELLKPDAVRKESNG